MYIHIQNRNYDDKCKMSLKGIFVRRLHKVNHNVSEKQEVSVGNYPLNASFPLFFKNVYYYGDLKINCPTFFLKNPLA